MVKVKLSWKMNTRGSDKTCSTALVIPSMCLSMLYLSTYVFENWNTRNEWNWKLSSPKLKMKNIRTIIFSPTQRKLNLNLRTSTIDTWKRRKKVKIHNQQLKLVHLHHWDWGEVSHWLREGGGGGRHLLPHRVAESTFYLVWRRVRIFLKLNCPELHRSFCS